MSTYTDIVDSTEFDRDVRIPQIRSSIYYTRILLLVSLCFIFTDFQFLEDQWKLAATIRLVIIALCFILLMVTPVNNPKKAHVFIATGICLYNAGIVYLGVIAGEYHLESYQLGTVIVLVYAVTLLQAPIKFTAAILFICWSTYIIAFGLFSSTPSIYIFNNGLIFAITGCLGMMAVAHRERYLIKHFCQSQILQEQHQIVSELATKDPLTNLPNRYALMEKIEQYQGVTPPNLAVLMLDIDHFKRLNDTYGHSAGDRALARVAACINDITTTNQGFCARYGGEEFILIFDDSHFEEIATLGEQLINDVSALRIDGVPKITITAGIYISTDHDASIAMCIEKADLALYDGKRKGRNKAVFYSAKYL